MHSSIVVYVPGQLASTSAQYGTHGSVPHTLPPEGPAAAQLCGVAAALDGRTWARHPSVFPERSAEVPTGNVGQSAWHSARSVYCAEVPVQLAMIAVQ